MPVIQRPKSNIARLRAFDAINLRLNATPPPPANTVPIRTQFVNSFQSFYPIYIAAYELATTSGANQLADTATVRPRETMAAKYIGAFYRTAVNMLDLELMPVDDFNDFGFDPNNQPDVETEDRITFWSNRIISTESAHIANGQTVVPFPTLPQFQLQINQRNTAQVNQSISKQQHAEALQALEDLSAEADALLLKLWNDIESYFDNGNAPLKRVLSREWGVDYAFSPGELPDPAEASVFGTVVRNGDGNPVVGVSVRIQELPQIQTQTDTEGNYLLPPVPAGIYSIVFQHPAYVMYTASGFSLGGAQPVQLDVTLSPQPTSPVAP